MNQAFPLAMTSQLQRIELTDNLELVLPDGSAVRVRPGPYGKGISVIPVLPRLPRTPSTRRGPSSGGGKRGRKPRASTVKLREKLAKDHGTGGVKEPKSYVKWLIQQDTDISLATARQVVYRERRSILENGDA